MCEISNCLAFAPRMFRQLNVEKICDAVEINAIVLYMLTSALRRCYN